MSAPSNWTVLIVDDEPDNIAVLELVLNFHDAQVRIAASGKECLEILKVEIPTLVIVDIQMPDMTGYELLEIIRNEPAWKDIPTVAVTALAMNKDSSRIMSAGFDGYIAKPVDVMTLADDLQKILESKK